MTRSYYRIEDVDIKNKKVFVRVDFNVPISKGVPQDTRRLEAAIPTLNYILEAGGKIILASHLGRPKGQRDPKYSLEPIGQVISGMLNKPVVFSPDCIGDGAIALTQRLKAGDVLLLENLRFHAEEEKNNPQFSKQLSKLCDVYINDAFGTLHRAHSSTVGMVQFMTDKGMGLLVQKELSYLTPLKDNPETPFALILGGAKVSDKIALIEQFLDKADVILIGGAMAYAFLKAKGKAVGKSLCPEDQIPLANRLIQGAQARDIKLLLPVDHVVVKGLEDTKPTVTKDANVPEDCMGVDIGPQTLEAYAAALTNTKTIFWNGPMGIFENPLFSKGTFGLAKIVSETPALKLAGGGDVASALSMSGYEDKFDFISTGGGATLEFLEGRPLPGLEALKIPRRPMGL